MTGKTNGNLNGKKVNPKMTEPNQEEEVMVDEFNEANGVDEVKVKNKQPTKEEIQRAKVKKMLQQESVGYDRIPVYDVERESKKKSGIDVIVGNPVVIIIAAVVIAVLVGRIVNQYPSLTQYKSDINRHDLELQEIHTQIGDILNTPNGKIATLQKSIDGFNTKITDATSRIVGDIEKQTENQINTTITSKMSGYTKNSELNGIITGVIDQKVQGTVKQADIDAQKYRIDTLITENAELESQLAELTIQVTDLKTKLDKIGSDSGTIIDDEGNVISESGTISYTPLGYNINGSDTLNYTFKDFDFEDLEETEFRKTISSIKVINNMDYGKQWDFDILLYVDFNKDVDYFLSDPDDMILEDDDGEWDNYGLDDDDVIVFRRNIDKYLLSGQSYRLGGIELSFIPDVWSPSSEDSTVKLKMEIIPELEY